MLQLSRIYDYAENKDILSSPSLLINRVETRPLLVGDSAYPLRTWLIKPYADRANEILTAMQKKFNIKLCAARSAVERAFGKMKTRWRIPNKKNEQRLDSICRTVLAICVLHNLCITLDDEFDDDDGDSDDGNEEWNMNHNANPFGTEEDARDAIF